MPRMTDAELKAELARRRKSKTSRGDEIVILRGRHAEKFLALSDEDEEDEEDDEDEEDEEDEERPRRGRSNRHFS